MQKNIIIVILSAIVIAAGAYFFSWGERIPVDTVSPTSQSEENDRTTDPLVGTWRSREDSKFTREFYADGSFVDRYEGNAAATQPGEWRRASKAEVEASLAGSLEAGMDYLILTIDGEIYNFGLVDLTPTALELVYLDRGNTLSFTKVK